MDSAILITHSLFRWAVAAWALHRASAGGVPPWVSADETPRK